MMFKLNKVVNVDESAFKVRPLPTSDADAIRADVLVYNQRTQDAQRLIDSVLRDDPDNAIAHESMGYLKFREGDRAAAKKWYGEAVKLDSQSYLAHYYYAAMALDPGGDRQDPLIESSLRTSIRLNPQFAPAYDALALYYMRDPAKTDEAHQMNIRAISLEPDNVTYRLNAAAVLLNAQRFVEGMAVLKAATHVAKTPEEVASIQDRIAQIEQYQTQVAASQARAQTAQKPGSVPSGAVFVEDTRTNTLTSSDGRTLVLHSQGADARPKYPTEPPSGLHHFARGILRGVHCAYPSVLTLTVEQIGKAPVSLYRNDFNQIEFSAVNVTPKGDLNPCTDIEGWKVKVEYTEVFR